MQKPVDSASCIIFNRKGEELCTGVADITFNQPSGSKLYTWEGTVSVNGDSGLEQIEIAMGRICIGDGRSGDIVVTHESPSILVFKGSGPFGQHVENPVTGLDRDGAERQQPESADIR